MKLLSAMGVLWVDFRTIVATCCAAALLGAPTPVSADGIGEAGAVVAGEVLAQGSPLPSPVVRTHQDLAVRVALAPHLRSLGGRRNDRWKIKSASHGRARLSARGRVLVFRPDAGFVGDASVTLVHRRYPARVVELPVIVSGMPLVRIHALRSANLVIGVPVRIRAVVDFEDQEGVVVTDPSYLKLAVAEFDSCGAATGRVRVDDARDRISPLTAGMVRLSLSRREPSGQEVVARLDISVNPASTRRSSRRAAANNVASSIADCVPPKLSVAESSPLKLASASIESEHVLMLQLSERTTKTERFVVEASLDRRFRERGPDKYRRRFPFPERVRFESSLDKANNRVAVKIPPGIHLPYYDIALTGMARRGSPAGNETWAGSGESIASSEIERVFRAGDPDFGIVFSRRQLLLADRLRSVRVGTIPGPFEVSPVRDGAGVATTLPGYAGAPLVSRAIAEGGGFIVGAGGSLHVFDPLLKRISATIPVTGGRGELAAIEPRGYQQMIVAGKSAAAGIWQIDIRPEQLDFLHPREIVLPEIPELAGWRIVGFDSIATAGFTYPYLVVTARLEARGGNAAGKRRSAAVIVIDEDEIPYRPGGSTPLSLPPSAVGALVFEPASEQGPLTLAADPAANEDALRVLVLGAAVDSGVMAVKVPLTNGRRSAPPIARSFDLALASGWRVNGVAFASRSAGSVPGDGKRHLFAVMSMQSPGGARLAIVGDPFAAQPALLGMTSVIEGASISHLVQIQHQTVVAAVRSEGRSSAGGARNELYAWPLGALIEAAAGAKAGSSIIDTNAVGVVATSAAPQRFRLGDGADDGPIVGMAINQLMYPDFHPSNRRPPLP